MERGSLIIEGNASFSAGARMNGGRIMIRGNAGNCIGDDMNEGKIYVFGEIGSIGEVHGGKIYHRGELIVDK